MIEKNKLYSGYLRSTCYNTPNNGYIYMIDKHNLLSGIKINALVKIGLNSQPYVRES